MEITASLVKELREKTGVGMMECKKALAKSDGSLENAMTYLREKGLATASKKADRSTNEGSIFIAVKNTEALIVEINCETDFVAITDDFKQFGQTIATTLLDSNAQANTDLEPLTVGADPLNQFISNAVLKMGENLNIKQFKRIEAKGSLAQYIHMNGKIGVVVSFDAPIDTEIAKDIAMHIAAANPSYVKPEQVPGSELESEKDIFRKQLKNEGKPDQIIEKIVEGKINKHLKEICLLNQVFVKDPDKTIQTILPKGTNIEEFVRFSLS